MPYKATVFNVFIASPGDVREERETARNVIYNWNAANSAARKFVLTPVGWDTHSAPEMGSRPQEVINKQLLADADLLVGVFWTRIGTPSGAALSGTAEEIECHVSAGKPAMLYFSTRPISPGDIDQEQYATLQQFKSKLQESGLVESFVDSNDFHLKLARQLAFQINSHQYFSRAIQEVTSSTPRSTTREVDIPIEAGQILLAISEDPHGQLQLVPYDGGIAIYTNGKDFVGGRNPRDRAKWEHAVEKLVDLQLIKQTASPNVFVITNSGFGAIDQIKHSLGSDTEGAQEGGS